MQGLWLQQTGNCGDNGCVMTIGPFWPLCPAHMLPSIWPNGAALSTHQASAWAVCWPKSEQKVSEQSHLQQVPVPLNTPHCKWSAKSRWRGESPFKHYHLVTTVDNCSNVHVFPGTAALFSQETAFSEGKRSFPTFIHRAAYIYKHLITTNVQFRKRGYEEKRMF